MTVIRCRKCDVRWPWPARAWKCAYRLPDGRVLPFEPVIGWCRQCSSVSAIEDFPDAGVLIERLLQARDKLSRATAGEGAFVSGNRHLAHDRWAILQALRAGIEQAQAAVDLMALRHSNARCLRCGATDAFPITATTTHPGCRGLFSIERGETRERTTLRIYDIEGALLQGPKGVR